MCGTAAAEKRIVRVHDVRVFEGHIACDGDSLSEIVVPVFSKGSVSPKIVPRWLEEERQLTLAKLVAIIDIDCKLAGGFDEADEHGLHKLADLLGRSCHWGAV